MGLNILINVEPDARGIYDGREVARNLVLHAYAALVPYVKGCGVCADALFSVIANDAITEMLDDARQNGGLITVIRSVFEPGPKKDAAEAAHLADGETRAGTACLLRRSDAGPHNHTDKPDGEISLGPP